MQSIASYDVYSGVSMTTNQAKHVWETALGQLEVQVTRPSYETWLKNTVGIEHSDGEFVVGTPNAFVAEMLEQRMYSLISQAMERITSEPVDVRFQVTPTDDLRSTRKSSVKERRVEPATVQNDSFRGFQHGFNLNSMYTFDNFIIGKSNELAHAAALATTDNPGVLYNPLVIHSDVGLGKTHLLHAIGAQMRLSGLSLIYTTTEDFTNAYIKAIRHGQTEDFRSHYRNTDALLLDDIQFLIGKEQTQEGFFHTFNALHMANKQIVITSDRPLTELSLLERRVRSRLAGGLVVDIQPPDIETRLAILDAKAQSFGQGFPSDVLQFLSERIRSNVRELEGALNRINAYSQTTRSPINLSLVKQITTDIIGSNRRHFLKPAKVIEEVAQYFDVSQSSLKGPRGTKVVALARQITMYILREETNLGPTNIGRALGGKDHSTVVKNCAKIAKQIHSDPQLRRHVVNLQKLVTETS